MPSYAAKPPLTLKKTTIAPAVEEKAAVSEKPHPHVEPEENFVSIGSLASKGREALMDQLRAHAEKRKQEVEKPRVIPPLSDRTLREMEGGRLAVLRHEEKLKVQLMPKPDPNGETHTPVYRPADYVPGFDSKDPAARTLK